ncbi:MAG: VCBS repeat-containing protein, partial [Acidobacteria bacterium]|nr:VCBS repeat-containing protein [Acidobacteriota bacterium]
MEGTAARPVHDAARGQRRAGIAVMRIPAAAAGLMAGLAAWCGLDGGTTTDGVVFTDVTEQAGIRFRHTNGASGQKYLVETMGPGCAFVDYDADGYLDIFLVNGGLLPGFGSKGPIANALYRNNRDGTFTDVTGKAGVAGGGGYGMGVAAADYDNDGLADLFVSGFRSSLLYHNHGDGTFREVGERAGIRRQEWGTSAAFFDYDRDGWLDLYVANYMDYRLEQNPYCGVPGKYRSYCHPDEFRGAAGTLYRNQGDGTFRDASAASGIGAHVGKGLGAVAADFNQDGFPDLYIANDAVANFLFLNNGDGTFTETGALAGAAYSGDGKAQSGMGAAAGDFNQDGRPDILVTNLSNEGHTLYRNDGNGYFSDVTFPAGVGKPSLLLTGWGTGFADYDNDGDEDIVAAHGHVMDNVELVNPT